jgi:hypothetical protein
VWCTIRLLVKARDDVEKSGDNRKSRCKYAVGRIVHIG